MKGSLLRLLSSIRVAFGFGRRSALGILPGARPDAAALDALLAQRRAQTFQTMPRAPVGAGFGPSASRQTSRSGRPQPVGAQPGPTRAGEAGSSAPPAPAAHLAAIRTKLIAAFNASQPVKHRCELAGRANELDKLLELVVARGLHAIIHGPRGWGKTSLARIFADLAGEAGSTALYASACDDVDFGSLMAPFFSDIPGYMLADGSDRLTSMLRNGFGARDLAMLYRDINGGPLVLIVDEFDRIRNPATKEEVAALLKLLSDMNAPVQLVLVGIAANVDDLLAGHPSLCRHVGSVAITPISNSAVMSLINEGSARAGIGFSDEACHLIVEYALGSPYHARLYCANAGLAALKDGSPMIDAHAVRRGLREAFSDWAGMNQQAAALVTSLAASRDDEIIEAARAIAVLATQVQYFSGDTLTRAVKLNARAGCDAGRLAGAVVATLAPILSGVGSDGSYSFRDSLTPHFLILGISLRRGLRSMSDPTSFEVVTPIAQRTTSM